MKNSFRKFLRAQIRDARVILKESQGSILAFLSIILISGLLFHFFYKYPGSGLHPNLSEAIYEAFAMVFFASTLPFPDQIAVQILFFIIPIIGLAVIADAVIRVGVALTNKQSRGEKWQVAMASTYRNHIIVCGVGRVGFRVIQELLKFGREVIAIEANPDCKFIEKAKALGIPVIIADARQRENLLKSNIETADAIIPCTDNELANLDIALDARELNPNIKVVMRMFDPDLAKRIEKGFGIHTAFSTSALTAPLFAAAAMRVNVKHSFYVNSTLMNLSEIVIAPESKIIGWSVEKLEKELDLSVVYCHSNETCDLHPDPALRLQKGVKILVLATLETLQELKILNQPE